MPSHVHCFHGKLLILQHLFSLDTDFGASFNAPKRRTAPGSAGNRSRRSEPAIQLRYYPVHAAIQPNISVPQQAAQQGLHIGTNFLAQRDNALTVPKATDVGQCISRDDRHVELRITLAQSINVGTRHADQANPGLEITVSRPRKLRIEKGWTSSS